MNPDYSPNPNYIPSIGPGHQSVLHGPTSEVQSQVSALAGAIGELSSRICQLSDRLHPVTAPPTPSLCTKDPEPDVSTPLGSDLAAMNRDLQQQLRILQELTDSIRL